METLSRDVRDSNFIVLYSSVSQFINEFIPESALGVRFFNPLVMRTPMMNAIEIPVMESKLETTHLALQSLMYDKLYFQSTNALRAEVGKHLDLDRRLISKYVFEDAIETTLRMLL